MSFWLLLACASTPSQAERMAAAWKAHDPAGCADLGELRHTCEFGLVQTTDEDGLRPLCAQLEPDGLGADECWFRVAEREIVGGDAQEALASCVRSGRYAKDCARHLWQQTFRRDPEAGRALLPRIREALPEHASAFVPEAPNIRAQEWKLRLRDQEDLSGVDCGQDEICPKVLAEVVMDRWQAAGSGADAAHWCERRGRGLGVDPADPLLTVWLRAPTGQEAAQREGLERGCSGGGGPAGKRADGRRMKRR